MHKYGSAFNKLYVEYKLFKQYKIYTVNGAKKCNTILFKNEVCPFNILEETTIIILTTILIVFIIRKKSKVCIFKKTFCFILEKWTYVSEQNIASKEWLNPTKSNASNTTQPIIVNKGVYNVSY